MLGINNKLDKDMEETLKKIFNKNTEEKKKSVY
jgi:hypothetical protein